VHHPVEDVGTGMVHARIEFKAPTEMGMSSNALDDPHVATVVCGYAGDDRLRMRHSPMFHVFLREGEGSDGNDRGEGRGGVVLCSRFWLGAALRPYGPLGGLGESLNTDQCLERSVIFTCSSTFAGVPPPPAWVAVK
jgi:DAPG hydrolase PhiG domain